MPDLILDSTTARPAPPERRFLGWERAALPAAAALLAEHYRSGDELRMADVCLVLPGARAGRRLEELLVDEAERAGARLLPPETTTIGALPERLYRAPRLVAPDAHARRAWARALQRLPADRLAHLFADPPLPADLRGWGRLARVVATLHREVAGAGMRFAEVVECCGDGLLFADTLRWSVLAEVQAAYEEELLSLDRADRDLARLDARELSLDRELWLIGVAEMPAITRRMLAALPDRAARVRVLVQAPASEADGFDALGTVRTEAWTGRTVPLLDEQLEVRGRAPEQAEAVVQALARLDGRYAAEEIVVGAADAELFPYIEQRLTAAGVTVHAAGGTPLERTRVARLLAGVADYLDGSRFDACAALARHPDLWRWLRSTAAFAEGDAWLEPLDRYFNDCLPREFGGPATAGAGGAKEVDALCRALADDRFLGRLAGEKTLAAWMPELLGLVVEVYADPAPNRTLPADRRLIDACAALRTAADALYHLPAELDLLCDAATAIRVLLDEVQGSVLAPDPEREAVELLGWLELRLDDAPVALVAGFNEPFLPESVNAHPFLPNALRERIGLVDNAARYARDAYELTALLHSRDHLRLISGRRSASGDPLRPSRLIFAVEGRAVAERVQRFYDDPPSPAAGASASGTASVNRFRMPVTTLLRADEPITTLPVTAFRALLKDPYRFALERVLRLNSIDDRARELDGIRFGWLAHEVLERFARLPAAASTDEAAVRRALDATLDSVARARYGTRALPAVQVQTEQLRARLHAFAAWQAAWIAEGWEVVAVECGTPREGVPFLVDDEPIHLTARIDRIDHHPESGAWAIFDYKTGDAGDPPEKTHRVGRANSRTWVDLQLPLYRHLLAQVQTADGIRPFTGREVDEIRLGYILLPHELSSVGGSFATWSEEELLSADECAREVVRGVRKNEFRFDPGSISGYRKSPLAALVGAGYLESATAADGEEEVA